MVGNLFKWDRILFPFAVFRVDKAGRPASDRSTNDHHLPYYLCDSVTELLQFRTVLSVLFISLYVKPICVLIALRSE